MSNTNTNPEPKLIGRIGDVNPIYGGGAIFDHGNGHYYLTWIEDVADAELPDNKTHEMYGVDLEDIDGAVNGSRNQWVNVEGVSRCCDIPVEELKRLAAGTPQERALAVWIVAGYHGWANFDSYPELLTEIEVEKITDEWYAEGRR